MERSRVWRWVRRGILIAAATAVSLLIAWYRGFAFGLPLALNCRYLSDGFFVVGFMIASVGALVLISTTGVLDIMSFGARSLLTLFCFWKKPEEALTYYDYKVARDARRGKRHYGTLLLGLAYLAIAAVCLVLYYHA